MMLKHDPEADAAYAYLAGKVPDGGVDHTKDVSRGDYYERGIDYDAQGRILGYEFLNVSLGVDLSGLQHRDELTALHAQVRDLRVLEVS